MIGPGDVGDDGDVDDAAMTAPYPVNLVVAGRPCLVVGAGPVGARKAEGLAACGARVTLVAPALAAEANRLATSGVVAVERRRYRSGEAADYWLVVTATDDPAVNQAVYDDAVAAGVWVNSADDPARCTFTLPAVHRQGPVLVTASTGGASPALACWLRDLLAAQVGPELARSGRSAGRRAGPGPRRWRLHGGPGLDRCDRGRARAPAHTRPRAAPLIRRRIRQRTGPLAADPGFVGVRFRSWAASGWRLAAGRPGRGRPEAAADLRAPYHAMSLKLTER